MQPSKHVPPNSLHSPLFYPDIEETLTINASFQLVDFNKPPESETV